MRCCQLNTCTSHDHDYEVYKHNQTTSVSGELRPSSSSSSSSYGLESCQLSNADLRSLDFTFNRLFMKFLRQRALMLLKLANLSLAQRSRVVF